MRNHFIGFVPPVIGTEGEFNTFRLGTFYSKHLSPGDEVYLLNEKEKIIFGRAKVLSVELGKLGEMCLVHGHKNHTELQNDTIDAPKRLFALLQKLYGPHIATVEKKATVIYLKRLE